MIFQKEIVFEPMIRGFHLIDHYIEGHIPQDISAGVLNLFILHTSAGLCINENADPSVRIDFESYMNQIVPENQDFTTHTIEGPDDMPAHIKAALIGSSIQIPIRNGKFYLGTWQGIYLCEFRNQARSRKLVMSIYY